MTSTAGSHMPSTRPKVVARAAVVTHGKPGQIGAGLARLQAVAQEHGVEVILPSDEAEKHGVERGAGGAERRHRGRARRRRHRPARADPLPRHRDPGGRGELRACWLPQLDGPARPRGGARACLRRRVRGRRAADARGRAPRREARRGERRRRRERRARPDDRARARRRRRGARAPAVRRDHLLDPVGLDGLQPLERRPGAHVGARGDGAHLRRGALAPGPPAGRPARAPT